MTMTTESVRITVLMAVMVMVIVLLIPTALIVQATFVPEICDINLQDGYMIQVTRWYEEMHTCEQLQQDYASTTYAEYQEHINNVNEAKEKVGKMFAPDKGLTESIQELTESIEELKKK
jgi:hypothetical protein